MVSKNKPVEAVSRAEKMIKEPNKRQIENEKERTTVSPAPNAHLAVNT